MGNEREIDLGENTFEPPMEREPTEIMERSKSHFLGGEILDAEAHPRMYSLEAEFRESASNRDYKFYVVIASFLLTLIVATLGIAWYIEQRYRNVNVTIAEFQDMNLRELLNAARNEEQKLALAEKAMSGLARERDLELQRLQSRSATEREAILSSDRSKEEKSRAVAANRTAETKARGAVTQRFSEQMATKGREVAELRAAVAGRRTAVREGVSKAEDVVNNYERLNRLRMERQKDYYENRISETILRYNPIFRDRRLLALTGAAPRRAPGKPSIGGYHNGMARAGIGPGSFATTRQNSDDLFALFARLEKIPFTNSSAPGLRGAHAKAALVVNEYESMRLQLAGALEGYRYAMDYYARIVPESGYIVDARNSKSIRVYMKPVMRVRGGERAVVFRSDTETVGEIELHQDGHTATLLRVSSGKEIRPFDRILVKLGSQGSPKESPGKGESPKELPK